MRVERGMGRIMVMEVDGDRDMVITEKEDGSDMVDKGGAMLDHRW